MVPQHDQQTVREFQRWSKPSYSIAESVHENLWMEMRRHKIINFLCVAHPKMTICQKSTPNSHRISTFKYCRVLENKKTSRIFEVFPRVHKPWKRAHSCTRRTQKICAEMNSMIYHGTVMIKKLLIVEKRERPDHTHEPEDEMREIYNLIV